MAIKVDLITGFLGSGKTTFLRKYVKHLKAQGLNVCILENDYGAVNVDMMLLSDLVDDQCDIEMVAGGCDYDCHKRRFKSKLISMGMLGYDRVVIEPSGIFDVDEFFDTLHEEPIDRWYECGSVICIADAAMLGSDAPLSSDSEYVLATEAADAGVLVFSKIQNAPIDAINKSIDRINDALFKVDCVRKYAIDGKDACSKDWASFTDDDFMQIENAGFKTFDFVKHQIMDLNGYKSLYFMNKDFSIDEVKDKARLILSDADCGKVIRIKGFVQAEDSSWYEINATKNEATVEKIPAGQKVIIVIGEELNREKIAEYYGTPADVHVDATS